jgi:hypothetical protein
MNRRFELSVDLYERFVGGADAQELWDLALDAAGAIPPTPPKHPVSEAAAWPAGAEWPRPNVRDGSVPHGF